MLINQFRNILRETDTLEKEKKLRNLYSKLERMRINRDFIFKRSRAKGPFIIISPAFIKLRIVKEIHNLRDYLAKHPFTSYILSYDTVNRLYVVSYANFNLVSNDFIATLIPLYFGGDLIKVFSAETPILHNHERKGKTSLHIIVGKEVAININSTEIKLLFIRNQNEFETMLKRYLKNSSII